MAFIKEYLGTMNSLTAAMPLPSGFAYRTRDEFVEANGRNFEVAADQSLPGDFFAFPKHCFDNAYRLARRWPKRFRYVEGLAMGSILPVYHAWVVDADDRVLDPTWATHHKIGTEYFGVVIPLDVAKRVRSKHDVSVIGNWGRGFPLLREPWKG